MDSADGLSLKRRSSPSVLTFFPLLVKHVTAPASQHLCVLCVPWVLVRSLMILQPRNRLPRRIAAGPLVSRQFPVCFSVFYVFNVGVSVRSQREVVPSFVMPASFFCFLFKKASHLLRVSESAFIEYICCRRWRYSAGSRGSQSVRGKS